MPLYDARVRAAFYADPDPPFKAQAYAVDAVVFPSEPLSAP